jgi:hypothetical protein
LAGEIRALTPASVACVRVDGLKSAAQAALATQQQFLQGIAVDELKAQRERLNTYMVQARFSLASIYDRAAQVAPASAADGGVLAERPMTTRPCSCCLHGGVWPFGRPRPG